MAHQRVLNIEKLSTIFVRNFDSFYNESKLLDDFSQFGIVEKVFVETNKGNLIGFVQYKERLSAEIAIKETNLKQISNGCTIHVGLLKDPSENPNNLFVKNLSEEIDEDNLKKIFSYFGNIIWATVMKNGSKSKGFGFVYFKNRSDAAVAVKEMNGKECHGKKIEVNFAQKKDEREPFVAAQYKGLIKPKSDLEKNVVVTKLKLGRNQSMPIELSIANRLTLASNSSEVGQASRQVASAILEHHEKVNGDPNIYPKGVQQERNSMTNQSNISNLAAKTTMSHVKFVENMSTSIKDTLKKIEVDAKDDGKAVILELLLPKVKRIYPNNAQKIINCLSMRNMSDLILMNEKYFLLLVAAADCLEKTDDA